MKLVVPYLDTSELPVAMNFVAGNGTTDIVQQYVERDAKAGVHLLVRATMLVRATYLKGAATPETSLSIEVRFSSVDHGMERNVFAERFFPAFAVTALNSDHPIALARDVTFHIPGDWGQTRIDFLAVAAGADPGRYANIGVGVEGSIAATRESFLVT